MSWKYSLSLALIALTACQSPGRDPAQTPAETVAPAASADSGSVPEVSPDVVNEVVSEAAIEAAAEVVTEIAADTILETVPVTVTDAPSVSSPIADAGVGAVADTVNTTIIEPVIQSAPQLSAAQAAAEVSVVTEVQPHEADAVAAAAPLAMPETSSSPHALIESLCSEIGGKLGSVSVHDCLAQDLQFSGDLSVNQRALAFKDVLPSAADSTPPRVMIIGGIHGDEYSSISIMFRWMEILERQPNPLFHWRFVPSANPDGLLDGTAVRQNANGVDLNRNFPSDDWLHTAHDTWKTSTGSNPRRFPGHAPASEPETQWLVAQIEEFKPDVIVSVHAPYDLLDYDGPPEAPAKIGQLYLHQLGVYPGSLGNYGGVNLGIPVVTLELPSAGIMPNREVIQNMWDDLHKWLVSHPTTLSRADFANGTIAEQ